MDVIPAIDLLAGQCVRLLRGDFKQTVVYPFDPLELARRYRDAGLRRLHVVDLDGARSGSPGNHALIAQLATVPGLSVQVGGGIRDRQRGEALLATGAARVVLGSVAIEAPEEAAAWLSALGPDRLVLAIDVRLDENGQPRALSRGWTVDSGRSLWDLLAFYLEAGARHFLCTDVGRDGTLGGPNLELYAEWLRRFPGSQLIASGGVAGLGDLRKLRSQGIPAVVTGKALLDGRLTLEEIEQFSRDA